MKLRRPLRLGLLPVSLLAIAVGVYPQDRLPCSRSIRNFTIAREADIMFDVVQRMGRREAAMAVVVKGRGRGRPSEIVGIISKEHIADSVTDSIKPFG